MSSSTPLALGIERAFEKIDIEHSTFPVALALFREVLMDQYRHNATKITVTMQERADHNFDVRIEDNGDGNADQSRLITASNESGAGTSVYAHGIREYRLKCAGRYEPWSAEWKRLGDMYFHRLTGGESAAKVVNAEDGQSWSTKSDHGFIFKHVLLKEKLDGHTPHDIVSILREVICLGVTPKVLTKMHVTIEVLGQDKLPLREVLPVEKAKKLKKDGTPRKGSKLHEPMIVGRGDSRADNWRSIKDVLDENCVIDEAKTLSTVLTTNATAEARYLRMKELPKGQKFIEGFPNYTAKNAQFALLLQDDFLTDVPLAKFLDKKSHPSSLNGRFVIVTVDFPMTEGVSDADRQAAILEPTSTKLSFTGRVYREVMEFVRTKKPSNWDAYIQKAVKVGGDDSGSDSSMSSSTKSAKRKASVPSTVAPRPVSVQAVNLPETDAAKIARLEALLAERDATVAERDATVAEQATTIAELQLALRHGKNE